MLIVCFFQKCQERWRHGVPWFEKKNFLNFVGFHFGNIWRNSSRRRVIAVLLQLPLCFIMQHVACRVWFMKSFNYWVKVTLKRECWWFLSKQNKLPHNWREATQWRAFTIFTCGPCFDEKFAQKMRENYDCSWYKRLSKYFYKKLPCWKLEGEKQLRQFANCVTS